MARTLGKDGGVRFNGSAINFMDSFELGGDVVTVDATAYGDEAEVNLPTFKNWNASVKGTLDRSDPAQGAILSQMEDGDLTTDVYHFKAGPSSYWYGSAVLRNFKIQSEVKGKVNVSFTLASAGVLAYHPAT